MKHTFSILAFVLPLAACTTDAKLIPVNTEVAADIPAVAALGWLQQTPKDMSAHVTPAYPQPCKYSEDGVITKEWNSTSFLAPPKPGNDRPIRPWQDFQALPGGSGLQSYYEYTVNIYNEGTPQQSCSGRVGLKPKNGEGSCTAYYSLDPKYSGPTDCSSVKRDVERTLTALKAMGVDVVPQGH